MNLIIKNINREKVLLILEWCKKKFGESEYWKKYPHLRVYKTCGITLDDEKNGRCGDYSKGVISIFLGSHATVSDLCGTVVHEYKHYLLNEKDYNLERKNLKKRGIMKDGDINRMHPHEKLARRFESKWGHVCYNELKHELYKKNA
jgi:hypothetical protein